MVIVRDSTKVGSNHEIFLLKEAPKQLIVRKQTSLFRLLSIVRSQEGNEIMTAIRWALILMMVSDEILLVVLALTGQKLHVLVLCKLPFEHQKRRAAHTAEFRIAGQIVLDGSTKLCPFGDGL